MNEKLEALMYTVAEDRQAGLSDEEIREKRREEISEVWAGVEPIFASVGLVVQDTKVNFLDSFRAALDQSWAALRPTYESLLRWAKQNNLEFVNGTIRAKRLPISPPRRRRSEL